jgi:hypothetical protein
MSRISSRRPLADTATNIAASSWVAGLVAWYAGGSTAIDRTLDGMALFIPIAIVSLIGGVVALLMEPRRDKEALVTALVLALGLALSGFTFAALLNRYADGSAARVERATVLSFKQPSKGPRMVSLELGGARVSFQATNAEGCGVGDGASVELRDGAFGVPWMQRIRCER